MSLIRECAIRGPPFLGGTQVRVGQGRNGPPQVSTATSAWPNGDGVRKSVYVTAEDPTGCSKGRFW